jgi:NDP-sugar pyrophosphorylase family protein
MDSENTLSRTGKNHQLEYSERAPVRRIRRAVILAAGTSQRLSRLGLGRPKPLIEVRGKPLLGHHLDRCREFGIEEVFINLHFLPEQIRDYVGDGAKWGLKVIYNFEEALAGTGGAINGFLKGLSGEPFFVLYGDNFCTFPLSEVADAHFEKTPRPDMSIALFELEDVSQSGVAVCDSAGFITSFIEKPKAGTTTSHLVNAGVYILEPTLLRDWPSGVSDFGKDLIPRYIASGRSVLGIRTAGKVIAVDTPELLANLGKSL